MSPLRELMLAANTRYLLYLSDLEDPTAGKKDLDKLTESVKQGQHNYRGFNLFHTPDLKILTALMHGGFNTCAEPVEASAACVTKICAAFCRT